MPTTRRRWSAGRLVPAGALAVVLACGGPEATSGGPEATPGVSEPAGDRQSLTGLILSDPVPPAGRDEAGEPADAAAVAYASLRPGTLTNGVAVTLRNVTTGAMTDVELVTGGFDPVAVPAAVGDSLEIRVRSGDQVPERIYHAKVDPRRRPTIVRTSPSPGRTDVPLNVRVLVVFSEPLAPDALADSVFRLERAGATVPGTLAFEGVERLSVGFTPAEPLQPGTAYEMHVGAARDVDGQSLEQPAVIAFGTAVSSSPAGDVVQAIPSASVPSTPIDAVFERETAHRDPARHRHSRINLLPDSSFQFEYHDPERPAIMYVGRVHRSGTGMELRFSRWGGGAPVLAAAAVRGDTLVVSFGTELLSAGFESGRYTLSRGAAWVEAPSMPVPREWAGVAVWNGIAFVIGGHRYLPGQNVPESALDILAFDPRQQAWRTAGRLQHPVGRPGVAVIGDRIYVFGDDYYTNDGYGVQVVDPRTGTVVERLALVRPENCVSRYQVDAVVLDGRIHVLGGVCWDPAHPIDDWYPNDHHVLDPVTGTWSTRAPRPSSSYSGSVELGGRIVGVDVGTGAHVYDPVADAWTSYRRVDWTPGAIAVHASGLLLLGGTGWRQDDEGVYHGFAHGQVRRLDPLTARAEEWVPMLDARDWSMAFVVDGQLYVAGGHGDGMATLRTVERLIERP